MWKLEDVPTLGSARTIDYITQPKVRYEDNNYRSFTTLRYHLLKRVLLKTLSLWLLEPAYTMQARDIVRCLRVSGQINKVVQAEVVLIGTQE